MKILSFKTFSKVPNTLLLLIANILLLIPFCKAQLSYPPTLQWVYAAPGQYSNGWGSWGQDWIYQIIQSQDGSNDYYAAGYTQETSVYSNLNDCFTIPVILKLDQNGNEIWETTYMPPGCTEPFGNGSCSLILSNNGSTDICLNNGVISSFFTIKEIPDPTLPTGWGIIAEGNYAEDFCSPSAAFPMPSNSYTVTGCGSCPPANPYVHPGYPGPSNSYIYAVEVDRTGSVISDNSNTQFSPGVREFWGNMLVDPSLNFYPNNSANKGIANDPIIGQGSGFASIDYVWNSSSSTKDGLILSCRAGMNETGSFGDQPSEGMIVKLDPHFNLDNTFGTGSPQQGYGLYLDPDPTYSINPTWFGGLAVINNNSASPYYVVSGNVLVATSPNQYSALIEGISTDGSTINWWDDPSNSTLIGLGTFPTFASSLTTPVTASPNAFATEVKYVSSAEVLINTWCNWTGGSVYDYYPEGNAQCASYGVQENGYLTMQDAVLKVDPVTGYYYDGLTHGTHVDYAGTTDAPNGLRFLKQFEGIDFYPRLVPTTDGGYAAAGDLAFNLVSTPDNMISNGAHLGVYNDIVKFDMYDAMQYDQTYMANQEANGLLCQGSGIQTGIGTNCMFGFAATNDGGYIMAGNNELNGDDYYAIKVQPPTCGSYTYTAVYGLNNPPGGYTVITNGTVISGGGNHVWSGNYFVQGFVDVQATNTLTINVGATVQFANVPETGVESKIVVEPGAVLWVKGTLTSMNSCINEMWDGIELRGQAGLSPANSSQAQNITNMGEVIMENGSTLSNANLGIFTMKINTDQSWDFGHTGGIVLGKPGAYFTNNVEDVDLIAYSYPAAPTPPANNKSTFYECNFITTDYSAQPIGFSEQCALQPLIHVCLNSVTGVHLSGNTFQSYESYPGSFVSVASRGIGISSFNATCTVNEYCPSWNIYTGCVGGVPNTFTDLNFGIRATSALYYYPVNVTNNVFNNNMYDVLLAPNPGAVISGNVSTKTYFGHEYVWPYSYGVMTDADINFIIANNTFTVAPTCTFTPVYGTVIYNTWNNPNTVQNNQYYGSPTTNGMVEGIQPQGLDWEGKPGPGLFMQCNTFNSPINVADIGLPTNAEILDPQGTNASDVTTANNAFSHTGGTADDIYDDGNNFTYNWSGTNTSAYYPATLGGARTVTIPHPWFPSPDCSSSSPIWWTNYANLNSNKSANKHIADSLQTVLNSGNAANLYTDISLMLTPAQLQDSLLKPGPYLSDGVMNAAIALNLPFDTLKNILVPNAPLSPNVINTFTTSGYYTMSQETRIDTITGTSARTKLQENINYFRNEQGIYTNAIIIYYLNDSVVGNIDSAIAAFYTMSMPNNQLVMLAALQTQKGDTTDAMSTIATIYGTGDTMYTNYCIIMPKLIRLSYKPNNFYALKNNHGDSAIFRTIAMDTNKPGYEEARVVLNLVYNIQFAEQIFPLGTGGHHPTQHINGQNNSSNSQIQTLNSQFNLYPNPANNSLTIQYQLQGNSKTANIIIYDVLGNKAVNWALPLSQNIFTENVSNLSAGIYFYAINIDNVVAKRGKVIIVR